MAVLGCDPPLNVGCLVEAGKGNARSRNLDTGKHRFCANKSGYAKMYYWGMNVLVSFDNDQELFLIGKGSIQYRASRKGRSEAFGSVRKSKFKILAIFFIGFSREKEHFRTFSTKTFLKNPRRNFEFSQLCN